MLDSYDGDARKRERQDSVMPPQNIDGLIRIGMDEFITSEIQTGETSIFVRSQGSGPPILLLHGFSQTHLMWRGVAPLLASTFAVVCADLRGYGLSGCPASARNHAPYAKRSMAQDMVTVMERLGFWRFSVAGHDRGGRVAYRMALDHPDRVERLAVLDVLPTRGSRWPTGPGRCSLSLNRFPSASWRRSPKPSSTMRSADGALPRLCFPRRSAPPMCTLFEILATHTPSVRSIEPPRPSTASMTRRIVREGVG
jgi:pimeloyl-ACP methyl ester carboxylesterase